MRMSASGNARHLTVARKAQHLIQTRLNRTVYIRCTVPEHGVLCVEATIIGMHADATKMFIKSRFVSPNILLDTPKVTYVDLLDNRYKVLHGVPQKFYHVASLEKDVRAPVISS